MTLKARLLSAYAQLFSRPAFVPVHRLLFKLSAHGLGILNHQDMRASGEARFLRKVLGGVAAPLVLDVGAHAGEYARAVLAVAPGARIHAFEPHPVAFARLAAVSGLAGAHELAVSSTPGTLTLYDGADAPGSQLATTVPGVFEEVYGRPAHGVEVRATTLDAFAAEQGLGDIELLKIDVEGHELAVLDGAERLLAERRIGWIQFEFNTAHLLNGASLHRFGKRLGGYALHRLLSTGMVPLARLAPYEREVYAFQNIVAKRL